MAKKRKKQTSSGGQAKPPLTSTMSPIKGMSKDLDSVYADSQSWFHARNAINNSIDGDTGTIGNEPANLYCAEIPYTVIGGIHTYGDQWVIFSTNDTRSAIGTFDDSKCEYINLIDDECLGFKQSNLIIGAAKENFDCTWQVYWDDGLNPSRTLNLSDIPWKRKITSAPGADCVIYEDQVPPTLDCELLRLAPLIDIPCLSLAKADEGGALRNGSYQAFIAYTIKNQVIGDYIGVSNIASVWSHEDTNSALKLKLSGIDKRFDYFKLVLRSVVANAPINTEMGFYSTETTEISIDFIEDERPTIENEILLADNPAYEKSSGMFVVNDYLIRTQPEEYFDFNYQPLANQINSYWVSVQYPNNYYANGGTHPTFMRDEQYTFFIRFIYHTGEKSRSYHIPGRPAGIHGPTGLLETDNCPGQNTIDPDDKVFKAYNTAQSSPSIPFLSTLMNTTTDDGGIIIDGGRMGYWESTEKYPQDDLRWNSNTGNPDYDLCGKPIRHHKMVDESVGGNGTSLTAFDGDVIHVLGVVFDNIAPPVDNQGNVIPNIKGYEILVGNRDGKKSIIAKGIVRNMMRYQKDKSENGSSLSDWSGWTGLMPNYPFNDLRLDPYLIKRNRGNLQDTSTWFTKLLGWSPQAEDNWIGGNVGNVSDSRGINNFGGEPAFDPASYTFHSPDTNFTNVYLSATEIKIHKTLAGPAIGRFKYSEDHPQQKLLKNKVILIAAIYGVGYALMNMRGKRNYGTTGTRSHSTGEFGVYLGTNGAPFPGAGTGYGAINAGALQAGIWGNSLLTWSKMGLADAITTTGGGSEANSLAITTTQSTELLAAMLAGGHQGPEWKMEMEDSEFGAVPAIGTFVTGILSFLNFVAIGGDQLIEMILKLISWQDYALKYISHGYYNTEYSFGDDTTRFRAGIDRARYIKQGIQSFDGNITINNLLRPSTVVVRHDTTVQLAPPGVQDTTKFTVGAGPCAGDGNLNTDDAKGTMSWWSYGEEVKSTCSANYVSLKSTIDNQYGQLDQILQQPIHGCFKFKDQQLTDAQGNLLDIIPDDRFSTTTVLFGGDVYINRYTEKVTMPFFYNFLFKKEGEQPSYPGYPFDYSKYSNVPFPRFWMNTEKYRMGEFVRPITNLKFSWKNAMPDAMYNLDTPDNGGYCMTLTGTNTLQQLGEGLGGQSPTGGSTPGSWTGSGSLGGSAQVFDPEDTTGVYVTGAEDRRYVVVAITNQKIPYEVKPNSMATRWRIAGRTNDQIFTHPDATINAQINGGNGLEFGIQLDIEVPDHSYNTPLVNLAGGTATNGSALQITGPVPPPTYDYRNFLESSTQSGVVTAVYADEEEGDMQNLRVIIDFAEGQVVRITNAAVGTYFKEPGIVCPTCVSADLPAADNFSILDYQSNANSVFCMSCGMSVIALPGSKFEVVNGYGKGQGGTTSTMITNANYVASTDRSGNMDDMQEVGEDAFETSPYNTGSNNAVVGVGGDAEATGGLFVWKYGYMYTHNSGINDFWVESDQNLAYRNWEDVKRKRHYDDNGYSDLVELFHAQIIGFDNYYSYDKSLGVRRFWSQGFARIQERWYDPTVAEQCFTKYEKRLIYSAPATGFGDKAKMQSKNDKAIDFWRVFLSQNFRDFKSTLNTIVPVNQSGALMLFPTMSPKLFQGVDRLQLSKRKITVGDAGLFSQQFQNVANSNVSHEYGSCESARSVLSTPSGIFFISQAQGKIFQYSSGKGLQAISDMGMKWWFNKFLPSQLLADFPAIEPCPELIDNPVAGAGCQTVYDPNNDIVYFSKRDYKLKDGYSNCIEFVPCTGFVYNATACDGVSQTITCPPGYFLNAGQCERNWVTPALVEEGSNCLADIVIAVDSSNSVETNGNIDNMKDFLTELINSPPIANGLLNGEIRIAFVHFGGGRATASALGPDGSNQPAGADTMFDLGDQVQLTDDISTLQNWIDTTYDTACNAVDDPNGTDTAGGVWSAMNLLHGTNSRPNVPKRILTVFDGPHFTNDSNAGVYNSPADVYDGMTVSPVTSNMSIGTENDMAIAPATWATPPTNATEWFADEVLNNTNYPDLLAFAVCIDPKLDAAGNTGPPNASMRAYTDAWASPNTATEQYAYYGAFEDTAALQIMIDNLINSLCPLTYYCTDPACTLDGTDCICQDLVPPIVEDTVYPIDPTNEQYFEDISWTVSYDPKSKAWISFHDWHPELTFNSIRHFLTTKSEETLIPQCPPGYTYNGDECCLNLQGSTPAYVNIDEFISSHMLTPATVDMFGEDADIVIAIDNSCSTCSLVSCFGAACPAESANDANAAIRDTQLKFVRAFINSMAPGMTGGSAGTDNIRIAHGSWGLVNQVHQTLTDDLATALADVVDTNYDASENGTNYDDAIALCNTMLAGSNATKRVAIIITDSRNDNCNQIGGADRFNDYAATGGATDVLLVYAHDGATVGCGNGTWEDNTTCLITTGTQGAAASNLNLNSVCYDGTNPTTANTFEVTTCPDCTTCTTCYDSVAIAVQNTLTTCSCGNDSTGASTTWDLNPLNPPCLPSTLTPTPPIPDCISCTCPDGYTMIGTCDNSASLPTCKKVDCECPSPYFNDDEFVTITGSCDDVVLAGTTGYVNADPAICNYVYQDCVLPNYEVGGMWKHNYRTDLFNNFYGTTYPWEVDLIQNTGQQVSTIRSIEYQMECYLYSNDQLDRVHDLDYNFDRAIIYNSEQISGLLRLNLNPKNNLQAASQFPNIGPSFIDILYSKEEQKYRFNQFWDITNDRGEFSGALTPMFNTEDNGYIRNLNPTNLNYNKPQHERKKFRHYYNHVLLRRSDTAAVTRKMLLRLENVKLNISMR